MGDIDMRNIDMRKTDMRDTDMRDIEKRKRVYFTNIGVALINIRLERDLDT